MKQPLLSIDSIRKSPEICDLLGAFEVEVGAHIREDWYTIEGIEEFDAFGADGSGGRYILLPDGRVLFISSEGSAGVIANNLTDFMDLITGAPFWTDILHFSNGGDLACMKQAEELRRSAPSNEEDWPQEKIDRLRQLAGLGAPKKSYSDALHSCVAANLNSPRVTSTYSNLFGRFTPLDNPAWRNA